VLPAHLSLLVHQEVGALGEELLLVEDAVGAARLPLEVERMLWVILCFDRNSFWDGVASTLIGKTTVSFPSNFA